MLTTIQTTIIDTLTALQTFKTVDAWRGDLDDLLKAPARLPAAFVLFARGDYQRPRTIGATIALANLGWTVIVVTRNLGDRKGTDSYRLLEDAVTALTRLPVGCGWLWPETVELVEAGNGVAVYGVQFGVEQIT